MSSCWRNVSYNHWIQKYNSITWKRSIRTNPLLILKHQYNKWFMEYIMSLDTLSYISYYLIHRIILKCIGWEPGSICPHNGYHQPYGNHTSLDMTAACHRELHTCWAGHRSSRWISYIRLGCTDGTCCFWLCLAISCPTSSVYTQANDTPVNRA